MATSTNAVKDELVSQAATAAATAPLTSVTDGLATRAAIAAELGVSVRHIIRYERQGMPALHLGKLRFYDRAKIRAWMDTYEKRREAPRQGRPAKRHAY